MRFIGPDRPSIGLYVEFIGFEAALAVLYGDGFDELVFLEAEAARFDLVIAAVFFVQVFQLLVKALDRNTAAAVGRGGGGGLALLF